MTIKQGKITLSMYFGIIPLSIFAMFREGIRVGKGLMDLQQHKKFCDAFSFASNWVKAENFPYLLLNDKFFSGIHLWVQETREDQAFFILAIVLQTGIGLGF